MERRISAFSSSLFLLVFIFSISVFAQSDDPFQKFPEGVEESKYSPVAPGEGSFGESRICPPSWFIDLPMKHVEVLLYDEGIGNHTLRLEGQGATLAETKTFPNDNYLLATVQVHASAKPTTLNFVSSNGKRYPWRLTEAKMPQKMTPADLVYLIMPDRFANGDAGNDSVEGMHQQGTDRNKVLFRHGGDLRGIIKNLDYLNELGITTLWLNPVLENDQPYESYHGYAVTDHYRIDRRLGSNTTYQDLIDQAHVLGIKVLMDIVPNHAGDMHFLYADMPSRNWWHLPETFQRSNFRIPSLLDPHAAKSDQEQMLTGWFDHHMPDFNQDNPHVRQYFKQLAIWWIGATGQDGYRVDTYPYSDPAFMAEWSATILENFPTVSFFGEVWVDGLPNQASWVPGNDSPVPVGANPSVTDFQLYSAIHEAMHKPSGWVDGVGKLWLTLTQDYMYRDPNALITFLDNHDLTRLATAMGEDETKIKSAITLLLTLRGTPMMYYGTEIGVTGSGGSFGEGGRKDMPGGWAGDASSAFDGIQLSPKQKSIYDHTKALANYRKDNPGLALGKMTHFVPRDGFYVYARTSESGKRWIIAYNSNEEEKTFQASDFGGLLLEGEQLLQRFPLRIDQPDTSRKLLAKEVAVWEVIK